MAFSTTLQAGTGTNGPFSVNFTLGFISRDDVTAYVVDELDGLGNQIFRTIEWITDGQINVGGAPVASGQFLSIQRTVDKTELIHSYANGSALTAAKLDTSFKQLMMAFHEALDGNITVEIQELTDAARRAAEAFADSAEASAVNAAASAVAAATSAVAIALAEVNAVNAASAAAASAVTASTAATTSTADAVSTSADASAAATSATAAAASAGTAVGSATAAAADATSAATSATSAAASATSAAASATSASDDAGSAATSASDAATSASAAAISAATAGVSTEGNLVAFGTVSALTTAEDVTEAWETSTLETSAHTGFALLFDAKYIKIINGSRSKVVHRYNPNGRVFRARGVAFSPNSPGSLLIGLRRAAGSFLSGNATVRLTGATFWQAFDVTFTCISDAPDFVVGFYLDATYYAGVSSLIVEDITESEDVRADIAQFDTRAEFIAAHASIATVGKRARAAGIEYVYAGSGTNVPSLPGWNPIGEWTVQHFGAVGDDVTNDGPAFNSALAAAGVLGVRAIRVPATATGYRVSTGFTAPTTAGGLVLYGDGSGAFGGSLIRSEVNGACFTCASTLMTVKDITFLSDKVAYPLSVAVRAAKTSNTDDMDITIESCFFENFATCVQHIGRGLYVLDSKFALSTNGVTFNWPSSGVVGTGLSAPPYGARKYIITGNHFHSMSRALLNEDTNPIRGAVITGNLMDVGRGFWGGPIVNSVISGNVIENCDTTAISISEMGDGVTISGNYIGGMEEPAPVDAAIYQATAGIVFTTTGTVSGVNITGNVIRHTQQDGILFSRAVTESVISQNVIRNYNGLVNVAYAAIRIQNLSGLVNAVSYSTVQGNTGSLPPAGTFFKVNTGAITNSVIDNVHAARINWS